MEETAVHRHYRAPAGRRWGVPAALAAAEDEAKSLAGTISTGESLLRWGGSTLTMPWGETARHGWR